MVGIPLFGIVNISQRETYANRLQHYTFVKLKFPIVLLKKSDIKLNATPCNTLFVSQA